MVEIYSDSEPALCPCRESIDQNQIIRKINHCGHKYHISCIDNWFQAHGTCPVCRHSIITQPEPNAAPEPSPNGGGGGASAPPLQSRVPIFRNIRTRTSENL